MIQGEIYGGLRFSLVNAFDHWDVGASFLAYAGIAAEVVDCSFVRFYRAIDECGIFLGGINVFLCACDHDGDIELGGGGHGGYLKAAVITSERETCINEKEGEIGEEFAACSQFSVLDDFFERCVCINGYDVTDARVDSGSLE